LISFIKHTTKTYNVQIKLIFFFSYEIAEFRIQELFETLFKEKWPFSWDTQVSPHCLSFINMSVQFFLHIFSKKFWLQFICSKLISTTAHECVKIISTKWFMHISHLISVNIFLENFSLQSIEWVFRSGGLQNPPPTPSTRPSMKILKTIVHNYNVFQVHYIV
jgi:hypothetical protein